MGSTGRTDHTTYGIQYVSIVTRTAFTTKSTAAEVAEFYRAKKAEGAPSPEKIAEAVSVVIEAETKAVADFKAGKGNAVGFLLGQVFKKLQTKSGADIIREKLIEALGKK